MGLSSTSSIDTIVVSAHADYKKNVKAFLRQHTTFHFRVAVVADSWNSLFCIPKTTFDKPPLILFGNDLTLPDTLAGLSTFVRSFPGAILVALGEVADLSLLLKYIRIGVRGFIPPSFPAPEFNEALKQVISGGAFISAAVTRNIFDYLNHTIELADKLTLRQQQIVEGIIAGLSYKLIAHKYRISIDTVREHIKNIYKTFQINSKAELMALLKIHYL
ncbi:helix-turn-helix transcriptional regulator [Niabella beijingensis]|uniref:helix-turn-helix transcriptional regulator n=1 Tax=Niabella beijingensis TaxID=2872700 RepID=UPI001CBF1E05|nr:LuxR C-terminal-related transcriptional regulator [Niabella beijingensis]MBZ4189108.1 LuxR C-terminal-related transcriptional regulator [Niabella beijingensis]